MTTPDVLELQKILNNDPRTQVASAGLGSKGFETTYFGLKTQDAAMRFQDLYKQEVLVPAGLTYPTGFVGSATRAKLNTLINSNSSVSQNITNITSTDFTPTTQNANNSERLQIFSITPSTFNDGDTVLISGSGFENTNTISFSFAPDENFIGNSIDTKTISITLSTNIGKQIRKTLDDLKNKSPDVGYPLIFASMQKTLGGIGQDGIYLSGTITVKNSKGISGSVPVIIKMAGK